MPMPAASDIDQLKKTYDPDLVDALLTRAGDIDLSVAYDAALSILLGRQAYSSPFDKLALERRTHETALIKEEVQMFQELRKLMTSINARYSALAGLPPAASSDGGV
jgi:hypothetical protein